MANPPSTDLNICWNIPWDNSYTHLRTFNNENEQYTYIFNHIKYNAGVNLSYIRPFSGWKIRVEFSEADLMNCNYIMFRNWEYSQKWFYAFITRVEYINDGMSEITFEIDWYQTWQFELSILPCYVEREHINNDVIGANTIPENLELGPLICVSSNFDDLGGIGYAVIATSNPNGDLLLPSQSGVLSMLEKQIFSTSSQAINYLQMFIDNGREEAVVAFYMAPLPSAQERYTEVTKPYASINGYVPKNKKLFTFPYISLIVSNNSGITNEFRYELFSTQGCRFRIENTTFTLAESAAVPLGYKGQNFAFDESVVLKNFPTCSFAGDAFKAWWAQNQAGFITSYNVSQAHNAATGFMGMLSVLGGAASGNAASISSGISQTANGIVNLFTQASQSQAQITDRQAIPDSARGSVQTSSLQYNIGRLGFSFLKMSITAEYARQIDDYFSVYGYKTNRIKQPNVFGRPHFNYVKTIGCCVTGNVPENVKRNYERVLDNGVWFWHSDNIGNFSISNG